MFYYVGRRLFCASHWCARRGLCGQGLEVPPCHKVSLSMVTLCPRSLKEKKCQTVSCWGFYAYDDRCRWLWFDSWVALVALTKVLQFKKGKATQARHKIQSSWLFATITDPARLNKSSTKRPVFKTAIRFEFPSILVGWRIITTIHFKCILCMSYMRKNTSDYSNGLLF